MNPLGHSPGGPSVGIVGGGILGMTAAYRLALAGVRVALYERSADLGGLVGCFDFDGRPVDRFYHVILPADDRTRGLATELGLGDRFRFRPSKVGFYDTRKKPDGEKDYIELVEGDKYDLKKCEKVK